MAIICLPFGHAYGHDWYSEYWQEFLWKTWECKRFTLNTYVKMDTRNHWKSIRFYHLSEQLAYEVSDNFTLEAHYTYTHGRSIVGGSPWNWQHRGEFEANVTFDLPYKQSIKTRNRLEVRFLKGQPKVQCRLRQRTMWVVPLSGSPRLKAFSMYNELFYNISTHRVSQNRICPCRLAFAITERIQIDLFFLVRFFLANDRWKKDAVVGTQFNF